MKQADRKQAAVTHGNEQACCGGGGGGGDRGDRSAMFSADSEERSLAAYESDDGETQKIPFKISCNEDVATKR